MANFVSKRARFVVASATMLAMLLAYQACSTGGFEVLINSGSLSSNSTFSLADSDADVVWSAKSSGVSTSRLKQVQRWPDAQAKGISLYPPVLSGSMQLNLDKAPLLRESDFGPLATFGIGTSLTNLVGDLSVFLSDEYTLALYVRSVVPNSDGHKLSRILAFSPQEDSVSGGLYIDFWDNGDGKIQINATDYFDGNAWATAFIKVPKADLTTHGYAIVARFTTEASAITIAVNGRQGELASHGNAPMLGNVVRRFALHEAGDYGSFDLGEIAIWRRTLSEEQAKAYSLALQQSYEQGGTDVNLPPDTGGGTQVLFSSIQSHFSVCMNCHTEVSSRTSILSAVGQDGATRWVTPGQSANSLLIKSLRQQSGALPMPRNNPALSSTQIDAIARWIDAGAN